MPYEAVVLDADGVLTHGTPIETRRAAVAAAFRWFDADPETEGIDSVIHGSVGRVRAVCDRYDVDPEAFWAKREAYAAATQRTAMLDGRKPLYDDALGTRDAIFVGESNAGIVAADRAGVDSAFVRRPRRVGYELATEPTYELDSLHDLRAVVGADSVTDAPEANRVA